MLLCIALNQFRTSQVGAQICVFHGHVQDDRHVPVSNLTIDQTLFIRHQKSIFQLGDISCYQQYFIDDN